MKKVFEHPTFHEVGHCESILQSHGIECFLRNQNAAQLVGEVPSVAAYPELWVVDDEDYERAVSLLYDYRRSRPQRGVDWVCANCGEDVPGTFSTCWNCQTDKPEEGSLLMATRPFQAASGNDEIVPPTRQALTLTCMVIAVIASIWGAVAPDAAYWVLVPGSAEIYSGRWDGLLGSVFVHLDFMHLAFDLFWFWLLGSLVETYFGKVFWFLLFLCTAIVASATELAFVGEVGVGLSGVVYGWFGFLFVAKLRYPALRRAVNLSVTIWLMSSFFVCFLLTYTGVYMVANGAHAGGLLAGALVGWLMIRSRKTALYACAALMIVSFASVLYAPWAPSFLAARAYHLLLEGKTDEAAVLLDHIAGSGSYHAPWAATSLVEAYQRDGDHAGAAKAYGALLPKMEGDSNFLNEYSWFLATSPEAGVRDGQKAILVACRAANLSEWKDAAILDTLAAAYAEAGDFKAALTWQTAVLEMGLEGNDVLERLNLYRDHKAYHQAVSAPTIPQPH